MNPPVIAIGCVANQYVRSMFFEKSGDVEPGHTHPFDHLSLVAYGTVDIEVDGTTTRFTAPQMVYIQEGKVHKLTALEDKTLVYCIHALRTADGSGDILDPSMIPAGIDPVKSGLAYKIAG